MRRCFKFYAYGCRYIAIETLIGVSKFSLKIPSYSEDINNKGNEFPQCEKFSSS